MSDEIGDIDGGTNDVAGSSGVPAGGGAGAVNAGGTVGGGNGSTAGAAPADWRASLDEDIKYHPALSILPDIKALAKSYVHATAMVGAEKMVIPKEGAPENEYLEAFNKLGRPPSHRDYKLPLADTADQNDIDWTMETFHKSGLTQKQAEVLSKAIAEKSAAQKASADYEREYSIDKGYDQLREQWRGNDFDVNFEIAKRAFKSFASPELTELLNKTGMNHNPEMIKMFANLGKQMQEDRGFGQRAASQGFVASQESARAEIGKLKYDEGFMKAYLEGNHPGHAEAVDRMLRLTKVGYPA